MSELNSNQFFIIFPNILKSRGDSHMKRMGVLDGHIEKNSMRGNKILFCGRGLNDISPLSCSNSKTTHNLLSICFRLITLKGTAVDLMRLNNFRGSKTTKTKYKTTYLSAWRYLALLLTVDATYKIYEYENK